MSSIEPWLIPFSSEIENAQYQLIGAQKAAARAIQDTYGPQKALGELAHSLERLNTLRDKPITHRNIDNLAARIENTLSSRPISQLEEHLPETGRIQQDFALISAATYLHANNTAGARRVLENYLHNQTTAERAADDIASRKREQTSGKRGPLHHNEFNQISFDEKINLLYNQLVPQKPQTIKDKLLNFFKKEPYQPQVDNNLLTSLLRDATRDIARVSNRYARRTNKIHGKKNIHRPLESRMSLGKVAEYLGLAKYGLVKDGRHELKDRQAPGGIPVHAEEQTLIQRISRAYRESQHTGLTRLAEIFRETAADFTGNPHSGDLYLAGRLLPEILKEDKRIRRKAPKPPVRPLLTQISFDQWYDNLHTYVAPQATFELDPVIAKRFHLLQQAFDKGMEPENCYRMVGLELPRTQGRRELAIGALPQILHLTSSLDEEAIRTLPEPIYKKEPTYRSSHTGTGLKVIPGGNNIFQEFNVPDNYTLPRILKTA